MNITRTHMIMAFLMIPWVWIVMAQFVAPKKKSASKMKEQCAQELGDQLSHFARVMQLLGSVQHKVLEHTYALLENDKENALNQKNGKELHICHTMMHTFNTSLQDIENQLQEYLIFLNNLEQKGEVQS